MITFYGSMLKLELKDIKHTVVYQKRMDGQTRNAFFVLTHRGDIFVFIPDTNVSKVSFVKSATLLLHLEGNFRNIGTIRLSGQEPLTFGMARGKDDALMVALDGRDIQVLFRGNYAIYSGNDVPFVIRTEQSAKPYEVSTYSLITGNSEKFSDVYGAYLCQQHLVIRYQGTTHHVIEMDKSGESVGYPRILDTRNLKAGIATRDGLILFKISGKLRWLELYHPDSNSYQVFDNIFWVDIDHDIKKRYVQVVTVESTPNRVWLDTKTGQILNSEPTDN